MLLDELLKLPPEKLKPIIDNVKQMIKNREAFYKNSHNTVHKDFSKNLKKQDGKTKEGNLRLTFSVPFEVYMSNPKYWNEVCRDRKLQKNHPEWQVGKS